MPVTHFNSFRFSRPVLFGALAVVILLLVVSLVYRDYVSRNIASLENSCRKALAQKDWPALEESARHWAVLQPQNAAPWVHAAVAARQMQQPQLAADYLLQIPDPMPLEALLDLGQLQMEQLNQPQAAIDTCLRTLKTHPQDKETHQRLLFYYTMTCQRSATLDECRRAITVGSDSPLTYTYRLAAFWLTYKNGHDMNALWLESQPDSQLYYVASVVHLISNQGLVELAQQSKQLIDQPLLPMEFFEQKVEEALERYPQSVELLAVALARACQAGDLSRVSEMLNRLPSDTANDHRFWRFKGWYHAAREQWPEARQAYEQALKIEPLDWMSQHELATVLRRSQAIDEANAMQLRANLGKELMREITFAPRLDSLEKPTYEKMVRYFDTCQQAALANGLKSKLVP